MAGRKFWSRWLWLGEPGDSSSAQQAVQGWGTMLVNWAVANWKPQSVMCCMDGWSDEERQARGVHLCGRMGRCGWLLCCGLACILLYCVRLISQTTYVSASRLLDALVKLDNVSQSVLCAMWQCFKTLCLDPLISCTWAASSGSRIVSHVML